MSAPIVPDLIDWASFADVRRIEIHRNLLLLFYPGKTKFLVGEGIHSLAPLLALDEPLPTGLGPLRLGLFAPWSVPMLTAAGYLPETNLRYKPLTRPIHHPGGTPFFLLDGKEQKWLVRLTEYCRMGIDRKCRVILVFNELHFIIEPRTSDSDVLRRELMARFPKDKAGCAAGEVAGISVWEDNDYMIPAVSPHMEVLSINAVPSSVVAEESNWTWFGATGNPKPFDQQGTSIPL